MALGVFDGVHAGHVNILKDAVKKARRIKGTSIVLTFSPHPQKEESLYSLEHRLKLIGGLGTDVCIVINFNRNFSRIKANDFIKNILIKKIRAHYIYIGKNFRFGRRAEGNFETLREFVRDYHYKLKLFAVIKRRNKPISSTNIRVLIKSGELRAAADLLSRPVSILGTVIRGNFLARSLGFPTANINPHHEVLPPAGVYAVRIIFNKKKLNGICYIGSRPTIKEQKIKGKKSPKHIEVHIFDFNKNIYGKYLEIQFIKRIRDEKKFPSRLALTQRVKKDIASVRKLSCRH